jgi:hypothetical protein
MDGMSIAELWERLRAGYASVGERLPEILSDPRAYPREAMLVAAIAALLLILVILMSYAVVGAVSASHERRKAGLKVTKRHRFAGLAAAVSIAGLLLFLLAVVPLAPATGGACGVCHPVKPAVDSWRDSGHASASCYGCHAEPGVVGAVQATLSGVAGLTTRSGESSMAVASTGVHSNGCLSCHESIRDSLVGEGVTMRHLDVIEAGIQCTECHLFVGHGDELVSEGDFRRERSVMSVCLTCHDGVTASSECDTCHAGRPLDAASAVSAVGQTDTPVTCAGCHQPETEERCVACHGLELPHPAGFMSRHAGMSFRDPGLCVRCHETAKTSDACACHPAGDMHGEYAQWFPRHGPQAQTNWPGGCNCHDVAFCAQCHETSPF